MRAVQGKYFGDIDEMLSVEENVAVPNLNEEFNELYKPTNPKLDTTHPMIKYATKIDRQSHILIKTLAVALAPGDCRVLKGQTRNFQGPPSFPYVPGGDCCGIVVDNSMDKEGYFQIGDVVMARFTVSPRDALGEYARVSSKVCEKVVDTSKVSPVDAAALASASPAVCVADYIREGDKRVLILGGGGGIGSHVCQLAKHTKNVSYLCGTYSTSGGGDEQRLKQAPLCYDDVIDYTKENVYELKKYQSEPFDLIIDFACGGWPQLIQNSKLGMPSIVKPASKGGRYITITSDKPTFQTKSILVLLSMFLLKPMWRYVWSRINPFSHHKLPTFTQVNGLPDTRDVLTQTLKLAYDGKLKAVVDGPYPMTTSGVRQAFRKLESRHPHGKVVIQVSDLETKD